MIMAYKRTCDKKDRLTRKKENRKMSLIIACQEKHSSRKINTKKMEIRENTFSLLWFQKYLGLKTLPYPRLIRAKMGRESLDEMSCTTGGSVGPFRGLIE